MAVIGSATLNIVPKVVDGLANYINDELAKADLSTSGSDAGGKFMGGFTSGANFGLWSTVAGKAIDAVTDSLGSAAARVDSLNNYPRVMEQLGASSEDAQASVAEMSTSLDNVPTRLDDMATTVQGLYAATQKYGTDLGTVTDAGLALNSMLLAGGQSTGIVNAAMEQFRQMVSKGKPELQDWRSMLQAAPGQMNQLAEAMLGAGKTADDLYAALGGGQQGQAGIDFVPEISMDEFIERFAGMRDQFEGAAQDAQGGIQTAFANMQNAVTKGVANVIDAFGQDSVANAMNDVKGLIRGVFDVIGDVAEDVAPVIGDVWGTFADSAYEVGEAAGSVINAIRPLASGVVTSLGGVVSALGPAVGAVTVGVAGFDALKGATDGLSGLLGKAADGILDVGGKVEAAGFSKLGGLFEGAATGVSSLSGALTGGLGLAIVGVTGIVAAYVAKQQEAKQFTDDFYGAVDGVRSVAETAAGAFDAAASSVEGYGEAHSRALPDIQGLYDSIRDYQSRIADIQGGAEGQISELARYKAVIDECAGAGEVSASKMAELQVALDGVRDMTGQAYDATDVLKGSYEDEQGVVHDLRDEIDKLIATKQQELQLEAYQEMYKETLREQAEAARELSRAEAAYYESHDQWIADYIANGGSAAQAEEAFAASHELLDSNLSKARTSYNALTAEVEQFAEMMGQVSEATNKGNDDLLNWVSTSPLVSATLQDTGIAFDDFARRCSDAGLSADDLAAISEQDFMRILNSCNGNLDQAMGKIAQYNQTSIIDKDGKIRIDDQRLTDALGKVYEFNEKGQPTDKDGKVAVEDTELTDAYDNVVIWNGTDLVPKETKVVTDDGGLPNLIQTANDFLSLPSSDSKHYTITTDNVTNNYVNDIHTSNAMATGGHVEPRHAAGFIAAGPTHTRYGLVGEEGVEAVWQNDDGSMDVYPLNNPRYLGYAAPLAESIAAQMAKAGVGQGGDTYIIERMTVPAESALASYMRKTFATALREGRA